MWALKGHSVHDRGDQAGVGEDGAPLAELQVCPNLEDGGLNHVVIGQGLGLGVDTGLHALGASRQSLRVSVVAAVLPWFALSWALAREESPVS